VAAPRLRPALGREAWRYYLSFYRPHRGAVAVAVALSVVQALLLVPIGALVGRAFDAHVPHGDVAGLVRTCAAVVALYLASGAIALRVRKLVLRFTKDAVSELRDELTGRLYALPRSFFDRSDSTRLHTVVVTDTERVDIMSNALVAQVLPAALTAALLAAVLLGLSPRLFLVLGAVVPPLYLMRRLLRSRLQRWVRAFHLSFERFSGGVVQMLRTMDLTRSRAAEAGERARRRDAIDDLRSTSAGMAFGWAAFSFVQSTIATAAGVVLLAFGGVLVARGEMTLGVVISFYVVMGLFNAQLRQVFFNVPPIIEGVESLARVHDLARRDEPLPYRGGRRIAFAGGVGLEDVSFRFPRQEVLRRVTLRVEPGEIVAITGPNGSGKTTVANLVLGFYRPDAGRVLADGVPYDELDMPHLRRQLGVLHQDPFLTDGTLAENIAFGRPGLAPAAVQRAAHLATADELAARLPEGLATPVGETGQLLSAGERQKIALARALASPAALLLLDEPTSNLDAASRRTVLARLRALDPRPAILVITHDEEVLAFADRVYLLRDGVLAPTAAAATGGPR
jgi:ABC-type multidrug transport system fused ATPase/permease subunit